MPQPEFISLGGESSVRVDGIPIRGLERVERDGGVQSPQYRTESGYEFDTRVGPQAVEISVTGWVTAGEAAQLAQLEQVTTPFPVSGPTFSLPTCVLDSYSDAMEAGKPGAHRVSLDIREIQQASTGTTLLQSVAPTRTAAPAGAEGAGGAGGQAVHTQTIGPGLES